MLPFDNVEILPMRNAATHNRYIVCYQDYCLEANQATADLLRCLRNADNVEDAATTYLANCGKQYSKTQIINHVNNNITPRFLAMSTIHRTKFLWQTELLNSMTVERIAKHLMFIFNKPLMLTLITVAIIFDSLFLCLTPNLLQYTDGANLYLVLGLLICLCISSFFHELGHASACCFYGIKHGGIGIGVYLTFIVLYTDVNNAWTLPRNKRCVVNFAGVYFQCIIMIILVGLYYILLKFPTLLFLDYRQAKYS